MILMAGAWSLLFLPTFASASFLSLFADKVRAVILNEEGEDDEQGDNSQTMYILKAGDIIDDRGDAIIDNSSTSESLKAEAGSLRVSTEDIDFPSTDEISVYEIKKGDTLAGIAKLFGVSKNTIVWANDLKSNILTPGETIVILPMTGVKHTVKKGDTISSIAKKYKADTDDIVKFNGISKDAELSLGEVILVPEGEISIVPSAENKKTKTKTKILDSYARSAPSGFLIRPLIGGRKTQSVHGHNGVDIGGPQGTPILASAGGTIILAKQSGYNGGYGNLVIIVHGNKIQTVYAHLKDVYVAVGQSVAQGETIGTLGNTGRSTGPHLHFEVRGAKNPF